MFWTDELVEKLDKDKKQLVSDAWSTSGYGHIGSLRGAVVHNIAYKALKSAGFKVKYKFLMDDFDPLDGLPGFIDAKAYEVHMGKPLKTAPAPEGEGSFADFFANDFTTTMKNAGVEAEIIWTSELYKNGVLNNGIRTALDNAPKIREIYKKCSGAERPDDWFPFSPICENCGRIGTTKVFAWDGEMVSYKCHERAVEWAKGCGHEGKMSPFDGNGKLPWRIEWPARWQANGVTVEGEGKDHWSAGGSRGMADVLAKEVFKYNSPYDLRYDFFVIGGKKMSSSKGNAITANAMSKLLPIPVLNYLLTSNIKKTVEFDPKGDTIPRLYDQYDRAREAYFKRIDFPDIAKAFELSQTNKATDGYVMRFSKVAYGIQMPKADIFKIAEEEKGQPLSETEKSDLSERIEYAKKWLKDYAPEGFVFEVKKEMPNVEISDEQKEFLKSLHDALKNIDWDGQEVHTTIHNVKKELEANPKVAFSGIYLAFLGKDSGPQAGWLLSSLDKDFVLKRLGEAIDNKIKVVEISKKVKVLTDEKIFHFDPKVKEKFSDLKVGFAIIRGVNVKKSDEALEKHKLSKMKEIYESVADTVLSEIPELAEYRRIYKATGVDPTKRMPSPFALLKRVQTGKDVYDINTVVDSYNLVVMEQRTSAGAFNLNNIKFPVTLTFSKKGDTYLPLLATEKEEVGEGELTWEDANGTIICRSLNYRDSEETKVDEDTKDLVIYVDGTSATSAEKVQEVVDEVVGLILKHSGGTVELSGVYL